MILAILLASVEVPQPVVLQPRAAPPLIVTTPVDAPPGVTRLRNLARTMAREAALTPEGADILERGLIQAYLREAQTFSTDPDRLAEEELWKV